MAKYNVYFKRCYHYVVEADNEDEAIDFAYDDFVSGAYIFATDIFNEAELIEEVEDED